MQSKNYFSSDCDIGHERRVSDLSPSPKYLVFTLASQTWSTKKIWTKKYPDSADQAVAVYFQIFFAAKYFYPLDHVLVGEFHLDIVSANCGVSPALHCLLI